MFFMEALKPLDNCTDGNEFFKIILQECVVTRVDYISVILGLISSLIFLVMTLPQFYTTYKYKRPEIALSIEFLSLWIFADSCNLCGASLAGQMGTQVFSALTYVLEDFGLLLQYYYYKTRNRIRSQMLNEDERLIDEEPNTSYVGKGTIGLSIAILIFGYHVIPTQQPLTFQSRKILGKSLAAEIFPNATETTGYIFGILSFTSGAIGRIFQLFRNYFRKTTDGVSLGLFCLLIAGNLTYVGSLLIISTSGIFILKHAPWLANTFGYIFLDSIALWQFYKYR